jgi:diguanylate cyclase (GGDEF)-like protein
MPAGPGWSHHRWPLRPGQVRRRSFRERRPGPGRLPGRHRRSSSLNFESLTPNIVRTPNSFSLRRRGPQDPALVGASRLDTRAQPAAGVDGRRRRRKHRGSLAAWIVLFVGIAASGVGAARWQSYATGQQRDRVQTTTNTVAATLSAYVQRDEDLIDVIRSTVATNLTITNATLEELFSAIGPSRYPGVVGLSYVERVPAASLETFQRLVAADPPLGQPVALPFTLTPAGTRPDYCLTRLIAAHRSNIAAAVSQPKSIGAALVPLLNPGFDYCKSAFDPLLQTSADTGQPEVGQIVPLLSRSLPGTEATRAKSSSSVGSLVEVAIPVYGLGLPTGTVAERQAALLGWAAGLIDPDQATAPILQGVNGLAITLTYVNPTGAASTIDQAGLIRHGDLSRKVRLIAGGRWSAVIALPPDAASPGVQALGLLDIGVILTVLVFLLLTRLARSRASAIDAAEETTLELRHRSLHDQLTGLPNRDLIFDRADRMLARAKRERVPIAAFFIDLDNFTAVNDSLGHSAGDHLLRAITGRLKEAVRASDTLGRIGGDQFVVLAEAVSLQEGPDPIAQKLLRSLAEPFTGVKPGMPLRVSATIGIAWGHRESAGDFIRDADIAMHEAKSAGKARSMVFEPAMHAAARGRLDLELDLRMALESNQFFVVYQPVFRLSDMALVGVEALLRWQHPSRGVVEPGSFIPHLEQTGMIVPVGRQVLRQVCRDAVDWHRRRLTIGVAVNASAHQLATGDFIDEVASALQESGLEAGFLTIEVTESVLMHDAEEAIRRLHQLKALGVRIAIDDFGTGYSSLSYLRQFPVDTLKIDRSFVSASSDPQGRALLHTMVQLGRSMRLETVAEGIEQQTELRVLQAEGCDTGQGFLLGRPMGKDVLWDYLTRPRVAGDRQTARTD